MVDIPEHVTLDWLARHLVEFRDETRTRLSAVERSMQRVRDDIDVSAAMLRRIDHGQDAFREDMRTLFEAVGALRTGVEVIEREPRD